MLFCISNTSLLPLVHLHVCARLGCICMFPAARVDISTLMMGGDGECESGDILGSRRGCENDELEEEEEEAMQGRGSKKLLQKREVASSAES